MRRAALAIVLVVLGAGVQAQWVNYRAPGTPRLADGRPNLAAPAPRAADGRPDLSGVWHVQPNSREEMRRLFGNDVDTVEVPGMEIDTVSKYAINVFADLRPNEWPMKPEGFAVLKQRRPEAFPPTFCLPAGIPLSTMLSEVWKVVQTPSLTVIMLELGGTRQVYTDGRTLMADPSPSWLGYSVGRWQGDTLVVGTVGFNGKSWLDIIGHPQSERATLTERYTRRDYGDMDVEVTVNDPAYYTRPFTVKVTHELQADDDILEYVCNENEQDRKRMGL